MDKSTVQKNILFHNMNIVLYSYDPYKKNAESLSNIECFDSANHLIWIVEKPVTRGEAYFEMWIDKDINKLIAVTGGGYMHEIDVQTGKVLKSYLVK